MTRDTASVFSVAGGFQVAVEPIAGATTTAVVWQVPVGTAGDPLDGGGCGESAVLAEMISRGAGNLSSREFSDSMDRLGVQRSTSSATYSITLSAVCLAESLDGLLELLSQVVLRPRLEQEALDASRELALQSLRSLQDDPQHFASIKIGEIALPAPFNRHGFGTEAGLAALTIESLRATWQRRCRPGGSMVGIAGAVDADHVRGVLEKLLATWSGTSLEPIESAAAVRGTLHEHQASAQSHICIAFPAPKQADPESLAHRLMVRVFGGGGMSNRLFGEVREKRALCYSVGANYACGRDRGLLSIYAGSTPERAAETLACIRAELLKMADGISVEEFDRAIIGLKSGIVMGGESTSARASALVGDLFRIGRVRSLAEVVAEVEALTLAQVNNHAARVMTPSHLDAASLVVVGPSPLL